MSATPFPRYFLFTALTLSGLLHAWGAEFPREVRLSGGGTLRNASPIRWMSDAVVIKHSGGADPIRFEHIAEPDRSAVIAARPTVDSAVKSTGAGKGATKLDSPDSKSRMITGEIFLGGGVSQGVRVKFAGASVYAYPLEAARNAFDTYGRANLPEPISSAVADGEGRFSLVVPKGLKIMIVAKGTHRAAVGRNSVDWEWRIADEQIQGDRLMLTDANAQPLQGRTL